MTLMLISVKSQVITVALLYVCNYRKDKNDGVS